MKVITDSYFCIGTRHAGEGLPCQDYAYAGVTSNNIHYAIVSDGCSASQDSDLGSRILTHWFRNYLEFPCVFPANPEEFSKDDGKSFIETFKLHMESTFEGCGLHEHAFDATLVATFIHKAFDRGYVLVIGDGAFSVKYKTGRIITTAVDSNNYPPYLSYHLNEQRKRNYENYDHTVAAIRHDSEEKKVSLAGKPAFAKDVLNFPGMIFTYYPSEVDTVSVFTDGISSFIGKPFFEISGLLTNVKSFVGPFVARTCMGNMRRLAQEGFTHYDDLSMATLKFNEEEPA